MAAYGEQQCAKWLKENCLVNVRKEWLDECFQFLKQEHTGGFSSQTQLNNLVYEQLLMADFQEMSVGTLPDLGTGKIVSNLQGKHILQINSLMDVGQSAYSQIQKLKGQDDLENQKENTNNNWEPKIKPSRMLFLHMTDGSKSIQAMEYQPIPCLNISIAPGTKVRIQGPVLCRQGVLLLTSKNVQTLGGSVEELQETNSMWKVLHNAIGQVPPELPTDSSHIKDETDTQDSQSLLHTDINTMHGCSQLGPNSNTYQQPNESNDRYVPIFCDNKKRSLNSGQKGKIGRGRMSNVKQDSNKRPFLPSNNKGLRNNNNNDVEDINMFNDEDLFDDNGDENFDFDQLDQIEQEVIYNNSFDDNIDENFDLDEIDQIEKKVIQNSNPKSNRTPDQKVNSPHIDNECFDDDFMEDDFDLDDFDMEQSRIAPLKMDSGHKKSRETAETEKNRMPMAKKLKTAMVRIETNKITSTQTRVDTTESRGRSFMNYGKVGPSKSEAAAQSNKTAGKLSLEKLKNSHQSTIAFGKQKPFSNGIKKEEETAEVVRLVAPSKSKSSSFFKIKTEVNSHNMTRDINKSAFDNDISSGSTSSMKYYEIGNKKGNTQEKKPTTKPGVKNAIEFDTQQSSMNTFVKKESSVEVIDLDEEEENDIPLVEASEESETLPFTYLSQVIKEQPFFDKRTLRIKGYISTLVSQTIITDRRLSWKVVVKVNDGSASIDAVIGEEILTDVLDISPLLDDDKGLASETSVLTELLSTPLESFLFTMLEAKKTKDPVKLQALQQQTVQFQKKLSQTSCLMDILFSPSESNPLVIRLTEPSRDDILGLISRLS